MKKLNNKGFTLIELLAVITILAILMIVAIPAVQRTIDNSRKDTYYSLAGTYISAVRNANIANELSCTTGTGNEYYYIDSDNDDKLLDSGGLSPWKKNVKGYVVWSKSGDKTSYSVILVDEKNNTVAVMGAPVAEEDLGRASVTINNTTLTYPEGSTNVTPPTNGRLCTISNN